MEELSKISIIVAIYKSERFLNKLLDSIINQTYHNIEIILVDDGSPDNSGYICDEYAKKDNRIIVVHKENGGACEARNDGLKIASGDYVTVIDGDDWLEPDYIEYLTNLAVSTKSDMAMTDKIYTTRDRVQTDNDYVEVLTPEKASALILYPYIPVGPWNKLYSIAIIRNNNIDFSVPWSGEGLYFSFMNAQYSNQVALGHKKIYNYRLNNLESGLTNYNVKMGINSLYNINNSISNNIIKPSVMIDNAIQWHKWKSYNYLLFLILATNSQNGTYNDEYIDCLKYIRKMLIKTIINSDIGIKAKTKMFIQGMFPCLWAKRNLRKERIALKNDNMQ